MKVPVLYIFSLLLLTQVSRAQEMSYDSLLNYYLTEDSLMLDELDLLMASDSVDIFELIENLLDTKLRYSQLSLRTGYTSDIVYAGRNFGFNQFGFSAGAAYYHQSGLFADLSGYWNSSLEPSYNPTIATLGFMHGFTSKWTYTLSYDHFFYQDIESGDFDVSFPLTNSLNASTYYDIGKFTTMGDYSFLFGEESAHRLRFGLMYTITKRNWGFIDRFVFMPSATVFMGNAMVYQVNPVYPEWNAGTRYVIRQIMFEEYGEPLVRYLWRNNRERYYQLEKITYEKYKDELADYELSSKNEFGIMNYSFSIPFYFYINNFTFALSYVYNIPVPLPGENLTLENNSYIGVSVIYNIPFKSKKK